MSKLDDYRKDPAAWAEDHFYVDRRWTGTGWQMGAAPIVLADYQRDVLREALSGRYSIIVWSEPGKSGKSTLAALASLWVALHTDSPECYCIANDLQGARGRVFKLIRYCAERNPHLRPKVTRETIEWKDGFTRAIAADYRGESGADPSLTVFDECEHFKYSHQERLIAEFKVSPTRPLSIQWYCGYGGWTGESSIWENLLARAEGGEPVLPHIRNSDGGPACHANGPTFVFHSDTLRQPWQTARWVKTQEQNLHPSDFRRIILNQFVQATEQAFVSPESWQRCYSPHVLPLAAGSKSPVILGLDLAGGAGLTGDTCALVAVSRWGDGGVAVRYVRKWDPPAVGDFDYRPVVEAISWLAESCNSQALCYDPYQANFLMRTHREGWQIQTMRFEQTALRELADRNLYDLVVTRRLYHYNDDDLNAHVLNAGAKVGENNRMRIVKVSQRKKNDLAVALSMAAWTLMQSSLPCDPDYIPEVRMDVFPEVQAEAAALLATSRAAKLAAIQDRDPVRLRYTGGKAGTLTVHLRPSGRVITLSARQPEFEVSGPEAAFLLALSGWGDELEVL